MYLRMSAFCAPTLARQVGGSGRAREKPLPAVDDGGPRLQRVGDGALMGLAVCLFFLASGCLNVARTAGAVQPSGRRGSMQHCTNA
eukprot:CAMPEP_0170298286 /NCGR_PEP_ID=MMETSP0116_2-20130129/49319_1 /TAXON_ID=400756 /ORGANISM="Durinskia baltica, Strain CSIRO CS-38" /LENGTH=85 /DNA_ID=CAMNT_0010549941 /DNA_START=1 /DNA_END=256 /DNA_ORIENTATION=+